MISGIIDMRESGAQKIELFRRVSTARFQNNFNRSASRIDLKSSRVMSMRHRNAPKLNDATFLLEDYSLLYASNIVDWLLKNIEESNRIDG